MSVPEDVTKKRNKLYDVTVREISLVDRGANQASAVILFKRDQQEEPAMSGNDPQTISKQQYDAIVEQVNKANKTLDELRATNETLSKANDELTSKNAELEKRLTEQKPGTGNEDPITKALGPNATPEAITLFKSMNSRLEAAENLVKKGAQDREEAALIAKVAGLDQLTTTGDKLGPLLYRIGKGMSTQADAEEVERILKAANTGLADAKKTNGKGGKETEVGKNGGGQGGDAMTVIKSKAAELQKSDTKMTEAVAIDKVLAANPDLYQQYLDEQES